MQAQRMDATDRDGPTGRVLSLLADPPAPEPRHAEPAVHDEAAQITRAKRDPAAFAPLYERYVDAIYAYCRHRIDDPDLAADLTAQIFSRAIAAMPRYSDSGGTFRSWLFSIAHNLLVDTYRSHRDIASLDLSGRIHLIEDAAPGPERIALQDDLRHAFRAALAELTDGQREVVELRLAGLTGPEIADVLGMKLAAVKSTQFRAYRRLRDFLAPYHDAFTEEQP